MLREGAMAKTYNLTLLTGRSIVSYFQANSGRIDCQARALCAVGVTCRTIFEVIVSLGRNADRRG
jgi:hypothetical protein